MSNHLARCTADPACPRRWTSGPDRNCGDHADDDHAGALAARLAAFEAMCAAPGDRGEGETAADTEGDGPEGGAADTR